VVVTIEDGVLHITLSVLDTVLSLKHKLDIPLRHIIKVEANPKEPHNWFHGFKVGSHLPGVITAGRFYDREGCAFYDVHDEDTAVGLTLVHEKYHHVYFSVPDGTPQKWKAEIDEAIQELPAAIEDDAPLLHKDKRS